MTRMFCMYKDELESQPEVNNISILVEKYGKGYDIMRKMGYSGSGPIGKIKQGILEPIQPPSQLPKDKSGLGYGHNTIDTQQEGPSHNQQEEEYEQQQQELAIQREEESTL